MRRLKLGLTILASVGLVTLLYIWPAVNTHLNYGEESVYATTVEVHPSPLPKKLQPSRFVKKGDTIALDDYFVPPARSGLKYYDFYTRFDDVVKINNEERTAKFEQDGVFTICGTLIDKRCEVIIAEEVVTTPH